MTLTTLSGAGARLLPLVVLSLLATRAASAGDTPGAGAIPIAAVSRDVPVDFAAEILPILRSSCLACHNANKAEADLVLESPQSILIGGAGGPAVVPGASGKSRLLQSAARRTKPSMPPRDNKAGAKSLTPEQLGLIRLWIDQGAKGSIDSRPPPISWHAPAAQFRPIFATAISPDGKYAACGRADQIFVYDLAAASLVARLADPSLADGRAHVDSVRSLTFSPKGDFLASGGFRTVKLWRRPSTERAATFGLDDAATSMAINPAGTLAAFASSGGRITLRELPSGKHARELVVRKDGSPPVRGLCFAPDGSRLYAGMPDRTVRGWKVADGSDTGALAVPSTVQALAFVDLGRRLVTGHDDGQLRVWDVAAISPEFVGPPKPLAEIKAHAGPITSLATWPTAPGEVLAGSDDGWLKRWDVVVVKPLREFHHDGAVAAVAARPDGTRFASAGAKGVRLWDASNGTLVAELKGDMRALEAVGLAEGEIGFANVDAAFRQQEVRETDSRLDGLTKALEAAKKLVEPAEKALAEKRAAAKKPLADREAAEAALTAAAEAEIKAHLARNEAAAAVALARAAVGPAREKARVAAAKEPKNVDLARAAEKEAAEAVAKLQAAETAYRAANEAAQAAERKRGEAGSAVYPAREKGSAAENQVKDAETARESALFSVKTASLVLERDRPLAPRAKAAVVAAESLLLKRKAEKKAAEDSAKAAERPWRSVAFSADGAWLLAGDDSSTHVFDANRGLAQEVLEERAGAVRGLWAGSKGEVLALADKQMTVYRVAGPWTLARVIGHVYDPAVIADRVLGLDFHPNGEQLASAGGEPGRSGELKIWNVATGKLVREFPSLHKDAIFGVRYSPNGEVLATASADRLVKIVAIADGRTVHTLAGHAHHARGVAWQADGKRLASCGADNVVKVWGAADGALLRTETGDPNHTNDYRREVTSIAFLGGSELILAASGDRSIRVHRAGSPQTVKWCQGAAGFVYCAVATRDGKTIVAGGHDGVLRIWIGDNPNPVHEFSGSDSVQKRP